MVDAARGTTTAQSAMGKFEGLSEAQRAALHDVDLGIERLHRAHGHLVAFHHNVGRGMNHLADAERLLRECGHRRLADPLRDEYLPRGVVAARGTGDPRLGRWSYDILESFQDDFLNDILDFGDEIHERLADGLRHGSERQQERAWKQQAHGD